MKSLHHFLFLLLLLFGSGSIAFSQRSADLQISIAQAPKPPDPGAKPRPTAGYVPIANLKLGSASNDSEPILAAVFERTNRADDVFSVRIDNGTDKTWSFLLVELSADKSCAAVLPLKPFSEIGLVRDSEVPVGTVGPKTTVESEWLHDDAPGVQRFAILASPTERKLREIFMSVEFLAGLSTGRSTPDNASLADVMVGQPKAKGEAFADYNVGGKKITITLGSVYSSSGDQLRSAGYYDALILIAGCRYQYNKSSIPFDVLRVGWLNNRGLANYQTGDLASAKIDYETVLELLTKLEAADRQPRLLERIVTNTNLGQVYATLGDQKAAIEKYLIAEALANRVGIDALQENLVPVYGGLGTSLEFEGRYDDALKYYEKALQKTRSLDLKASEGIILNSLGRLAANSGKRAEAEKYFQQAIELSEQTGNQAGIGSASNNLGWFYVQDKRYADAQAAFVRSSEIFAALGNRTAQATALGNLMFVERLQERPAAAIFFGKQAVRLLQSVRSGLTNIEKQLQRSFLVSREETYRILADTLISSGRLLEAQAILDLLKDEEHSSPTRVRSGTGAEAAPYTEAEEMIQLKVDELSDLRRMRAELQAERSRLGNAFTRQAELDSVDKSIGLVNAAFRRSLERLATTEASVSERVSSILAERNLQSILSTLKKEHDTEAVAIYTVIGTEQASAGGTSRTKFGWTILVTPTDRKAYPMDVRDLEGTVRRFRSALTSDRYDPRPDGQKLYDAIFRQTSPSQKTTLEKDLEKALVASPNKTVMWSLDGVLRYIPAGALHDGTQYLVEKYRNVVFTSRSLGQLQAANNSAWKVLGMGVSDARAGFSALAGAKEELEYIVGPRMFGGAIMLNEKFNKADTIRAWRDKQYPVIHIASHFKFHPTKPGESFLLLGDGELRIEDLENEDNLFDGVDLLALSACDTAMSANGRESESLAYLAQDLGAKTVLASLWPVSDAGTPELMARFYALRAADPKMTKGEAYARSQLSLLRGEKIETRRAETKSTDPDTNGQGAKRADEFGGSSSDLPAFVRDRKRPFAHPYYWAPFILIGNWR